MMDTLEKTIQKEVGTLDPVPKIKIGNNEIMMATASYIDLHNRWSKRADYSAMELYNITLKEHNYNKQLFKEYILSGDNVKFQMTK